MESFRCGSLGSESQSPLTPLRPPTPLSQTWGGQHQEASFPALNPHSHPLQELQGKVMEAAAALDTSRGGPEP